MANLFWKVFEGLQVYVLAEEKDYFEIIDK